MEDVETGIILLYPVGVDDDGIGRDYNELRITEFSLFTDGKRALLEEDDAAL